MESHVKELLPGCKERVFLPIFDISGNGSLNDDEILYLRSGCLALLPKDAYGNCYLVVNRYRLQQIVPVLDLIPRLRLLFYIMSLAAHDYYQGHSNDVIGDIDSDTGLVVLNIVLSIVPSITRNLKDLIVEAFPIRVITIHTIFYPTKSNLFSLDKYIIPSYFSINAPILTFSNLIIHYCRSETEAASKLHQRGVPLESIPSILGGSWSYDSFDDWFEETYHDSKSFDINNTQVPPDIVEESVVVSDTAHTLLNSSMSDTSISRDQSSDSAPIFTIFGNLEGSKFNALESKIQTNNMREIYMNDISILLPEGAIKSQLNHHYQQQAIEPSKPCTVGDLFDGNAESNFPKQSENVSKTCKKCV